MKKSSKIALGVAAGAAALVLLKKKKEGSVAGIGDLTAWNKKHLADYLDRAFLDEVIVNSAFEDEKGYVPVDFISDGFVNFTYKISPGNINYLHKLCDTYGVKFVLVNDKYRHINIPDLHRVYN